ncbi:hypothetical protein SAMN05443572_107369 [Myxococcus fulvus]|uniref:DUF6310 domain-containing protein n=1 Tax=Myxococcus fulvus TaxID=33 RepID=A0A511TDF9_MYXFU|nr:DUF6310 domain-containing protein [Myxococcus fulvus]GEN12211.1 hypothetical protein MFU01_72480 [Myxococcus fulvus]SEU27042.1 hypothetical protein SAMN05443572_107369 [Myxococcus fulvus]
MSSRACAALLLFFSACATSAPGPRELGPRATRLANLQRAAELPWKDDGRCVVREASQPWPVLAERCFHALDHDRVRFNDPTRRCTVASAGAAALGIGLCVLAAPEIVVGAVVVLGVVVVGFVIEEALEAYELRGSNWEDEEASLQTKPTLREPSANRKPEPTGQDAFPPVPTEPTEQERRPECRPIPVPHAGNDAAHNTCADTFPPNRYPGMDVLVNGVRFDALQVGARVLWEIKTHQFDTYNAFVQRQEIEREYAQLRRERAAAAACGYKFVVGVSTQAHRVALLRRDQSFTIVVTDCRR